MAGLTTAQFTDLDALIENFKDESAPFFTITDYQGNILKRNEKEDDIHQASEIVRSYFKGIDKSTQAVFTVRQFDEVPKGGLKKTSDPTVLTTYKQPRYNSMSGEGEGQQRQSYFYQSQRELLDEIREMKRDIQDMKLAAIEGDDDDDLKQQAEPVNYLGAILGNPAIMQVLTNLLTNIGANLATPHIQTAANMPRPIAMAGISQDAEPVLEILFSKGVTIRDLELLAAKPQAELDFLLSMLRK